MENKQLKTIEPQKSYLVVKEPQNPKQALLSSIFPLGHPTTRATGSLFPLGTTTFVKVMGTLRFKNVFL